MSSSNDLPIHDELVSNDKVYVEQSVLLFKSMPISIGGTFVGIFFMAYMLWGNIDHTAILIWAGIFCLVTILRAAHSIYFLRTQHTYKNMHIWSMQFTIGAISAALLWTSTTVFLFPEHDPIRQLMLTLILTTSGAVAIINISIMRHIAISFMLIVLVPLAIRFFIADQPSSALMGVMVLFALSLYLVGAARVNQNIVDNIKLRLIATESEKQLRHSQQRLALHIMRTPLAVIEFSPDLNIVEWNNAAEDIFGYTRAEAIGKNYSELFLPESGKELINEIQTKLHNKEPGLYNISKNITKDGRTILCEWFNTPLIDEQEHVIGMASLAHDVTDRMRLEKLKNEFVSTVSHELRTPLTSLRGSLGLILGGVTGEIPTKVHELISMANNNAERLQHLINDLLDMQKIESGQVDYNFRTLPIMPIIEQSRQENIGYAKQRNINLKITKRVDNAYVKADHNRLHQVLDNLLSNAIKFSPEHTTVEISTEHRDDNIRVSIIDQGRGIPKEFRSQLFEKFTQGDASTTRDFAGTGLGLSIAKGIIKQHRGTIGYTPGKQKGSSFYFELPASPADHT